VTVLSLRFHTYDGVERPEGTTYDADPAYVDTLEALGMARRVAEGDKPARTAHAAPPPAPKKNHK
jgi:hypothetical protein